MSRARASYKHLCQSLGNLRGVSAVAVEHLRVKLAFAIAGDFQIREPTRGRDQIALGIAIAIAFAAADSSRPTPLR